MAFEPFLEGIKSSPVAENIVAIFATNCNYVFGILTGTTCCGIRSISRSLIHVYLTDVTPILAGIQSLKSSPPIGLLMEN